MIHQMMPLNAAYHHYHHPFLLSDIHVGNVYWLVRWLSSLTLKGVRSNDKVIMDRDIVNSSEIVEKFQHYFGDISQIRKMNTKWLAFGCWYKSMISNSKTFWNSGISSDAIDPLFRRQILSSNQNRTPKTLARLASDKFFLWLFLIVSKILLHLLIRYDIFFMLNISCGKLNMRDWKKIKIKRKKKR